MKSDPFNEFTKFHDSNPQVYAAFARIAKRDIGRWERRSGDKPRLSAYDIIDEVRGDKRLKTTTMRTTGRKIDRNHVPFYARMFMRLNPDYDGVFKLRSGKHVSEIDTLFGTEASTPKKKNDDDYDHY